MRKHCEMLKALVLPFGITWSRNLLYTCTESVAEPGDIVHSGLSSTIFETRRGRIGQAWTSHMKLSDLSEDSVIYCE